MSPTGLPPIVPPFPRAHHFAITGRASDQRCAACIAAARPTAPTVPESPEPMIAALIATGAFRVLRRLEPRSTYEDPCGAATHTALYVDVETTGLDHAKDHIIQLAVVPFAFTADGRVCTVAASEAWFEDPGVPLDPAITRLTGIRDADVAGKRIDDARVEALLRNAALVIAHNARFDRPFLERRLPGFAEKPWACSMADVPWQEEGLPTTKLEWLAERHSGVFYEAHRADVDCRVGVHLLASTLPSGRRAMESLLGAVRAKTVRVWAVESPFATKDLLKARGYRWSGGEGGAPKAWYRDVGEGVLAEEATWLRAHIYMMGTCPAVVQRIGARTRYSHRIAALPMQRLAAAEPADASPGMR